MVFNATFNNISVLHEKCIKYTLPRTKSDVDSVRGLVVMVFNATFNNSSVISRRRFNCWRKRRKPPTCHKSLANFITKCCIEYRFLFNDMSNMFSWIFVIVIAPCNSSPRIDMSLHSDTLFLTPNKPVFVLTPQCCLLSEAANINLIVFVFTRSSPSSAAR